MVKKRNRHLQIDTHTPSTLGNVKEDTVLEDFDHGWNPLFSFTPINKETKRYSTSIIHSAVEQRQLDIKRSHHRSASADNELASSLPRVSSVPELNQTSIKPLTKNASQRKRWFQLPRMTLKRNPSTPVRRIDSGTRTAAIEPPEPPPRLLFNLQWSSEYIAASPLIWNSDDNSSNSISTPTSPTISRKSSKIEIEFSDYLLNSPDRVTISQQLDTAFMNRRLSCPVYDQTIETSQGSAVKDDSTVYSHPKRLSLLSKAKTMIDSSTTNHACNTTNVRLFSKSCPRSLTQQRPRLKKTSDISNSNSSSSSSIHSLIASSTTSISSSSSGPATPDNECHLGSVLTPNASKCVINFGNIKPRSFKMKRRCNPKQELKALSLWQQELTKALEPDRYTLPKIDVDMISDKRERYSQTRKFILREFYTTEVNFWNQLNYAKVMFCDPLVNALERNISLVKPADIDLFANLEDLMKFSLTLIYRLRKLELEQRSKDGSRSNVWPISDINVGSVLRDMAELMVVFLRCALDYRANRELIDKKHQHKVYTVYKEKLALRKETRQFTFEDYLIIPIQRITRYGLLLADLEKHTEASHPDYEDIRISRKIVQSLASTMNLVQK
ncbi:hypothetical protein RMCBS344292_01018 [Rhizopus microsporus]|nr:hypothetical protein RMCBS344292_01018 [Rhizopus microsporus]